MSPVRKRSEIVIELRTRAGRWEEVRFRVDPGAELTHMSLDRARPADGTNPEGYDLDAAFTPRTVTKRLADGSTRPIPMQLGTLTARFPAHPTFVFRWECLFEPTVAPTELPLLGLGGRVLSDLTLTFRGPSREFVDGSLAVDIRANPVPLFPPGDPQVWATHYAPAGRTPPGSIAAPPPPGRTISPPASP